MTLFREGDPVTIVGESKKTDWRFYRRQSAQFIEVYKVDAKGHKTFKVFEEWDVSKKASDKL